MPKPRTSITAKPPRILALDAASRTGWAHSDGSSGVVTIPPKDDTGHNGRRFRAFLAWLEATAAEHETSTIVYEAGSHTRGGDAMRLLVGLATVIELFGARRGMKVYRLNTMHIKKHATGSGLAKKEDMIAAALKRFPTCTFVRNKKGGYDDNQIDALWCLDLALQTLEW